MAVFIQRWADRHGGQAHDLAAAQHLHGMRLFGAVEQIRQCVDRAAGLTVHLQKDIPLLQDSGALGILAEIRYRCAAKPPLREDQHQQHRHAKQKIHQRTAKRHKKALPCRGLLKLLPADRQREQRSFARRGALLCRRVCVLLRGLTEQVVAAQREKAQ